MILEHHDSHFRLEITSLEEFAHFVAIIRSEELDADKLHELTVRLTKKNAALKTALEGAPDGKQDS
jgi:hypothetical protein